MPVADSALSFLREPTQLARQVDQLTHLIRSLDNPGASMNVAKLATEMMDEKQIA